ncbi:hypothetical protein ACI79D_09720 [Geodermatophilus sp. SYSU D00708]
MASRYDALKEHLTNEENSSLAMTFDDVGGIVGGLPPSASRHREWWSNGSHSHSTAWTGAGWRVSEVDLRGQRVVFTRSSPGATALRRRTRATQPFAPGPVVDLVTASVHFAWCAAGRVLLDESGTPAFPSLPETPGLYRLDFTRTGPERPRIYVGEAADLRRRANGYRTPGHAQQTNLRVNALLRDHIGSGDAVELSIATEAVARVGQGPDRPLDLTRKANRLLAENAALLALHDSGAVDIENLG